MTSNVDGMKYKKVKETPAERLLKQNYDATLAHLQALNSHNKKQEKARSRASAKVLQMRSSSHGSSQHRSDKALSRSNTQKGAFLDGLDINMGANVNINVKNTEELLE